MDCVATLAMTGGAWDAVPTSVLPKSSPICTMVCAGHIMAAAPFQIERRMDTTTPTNRPTTQRRLLQRAGGDAHGCSNDALVQSIFNSGPDWADYAHGAFAWRDRRSGDHCARNHCARTQ